MRQKGCRKKKKKQRMKNGEKNGSGFAVSVRALEEKKNRCCWIFFGTPEEIWQADEREIGEVFWKNEEHKKAFFRVKKLPGMRDEKGME